MQAELIRHQRRLRAVTEQTRKAETRKKIQHGGLIKKVGLAQESTAVLLGLLLDAAEQLTGEEGAAVRAGWRLKGDIVLTQERAEKEGTRHLHWTS